MAQVCVRCGQPLADILLGSRVDSPLMAFEAIPFGQYGSEAFSPWAFIARGSEAFSLWTPIEFAATERAGFWVERSVRSIWLESLLRRQQ